MECTFIKDSFLAITENIDGKKYVLTANRLNQILDDWNGECDYVPENDAKVYFAMFNDKIINPYEIETFEDLLKYLKNYYHIN